MLFLLLLTNSASTCPWHFCNLGPALYWSPELAEIYQLCIVADEPTRSQEVFSSTESSDEDEDDFEDEGDTNEGEDEQEEEEEEDDDEVFVLQSDLNFPPKQKLQQQQVKKKRNGEISPPSFAAAAAFPPGKNNSAANHGVKMVEGLGGDVADVLEVGHDLCLHYPPCAGYSDVAGNRKSIFKVVYFL